MLARHQRPLVGVIRLCENASELARLSRVLLAAKTGGKQRCRTTLTPFGIRGVRQWRLPVTDAHAGRRAGMYSVRLGAETLAGLMRDPGHGKATSTDVSKTTTHKHSPLGQHQTAAGPVKKPF